MTTTNTIAAHATPAPASGQFGTPNQPGRIYLSGPMSGLPEHNYPAFNAAAARLRAQGHDVVNPAELNPDASTDWHACLRRDIAALTTCNTLALMPGWEHSQGAVPPTLGVHQRPRLVGREPVGLGHRIPAPGGPAMNTTHIDLRIRHPSGSTAHIVAHDVPPEVGRMLAWIAMHPHLAARLLPHHERLLERIGHNACAPEAQP